MIVTVTAHPSLDRTVELAHPLRPGEVQPAAAAREDAGGKGINVARVVAEAGMGVAAVLPLAADDPFAAVVAATGLIPRAVPIAGRARSNLTIVDPTGSTTKLNLAGPELSGAEANALIAAVVAASETARWLVLAGSLPPGAGSDFYVRTIAAVRDTWGASAPRVAVDTSGEALQRTVAHSHPDLIKPNELELAELTGSTADPADPVAVATLARSLVPDAVGEALVTLGAAGALLVTPDGVWVGTAPRIVPVSTVGAGDSSLAGYLLADLAARPPEERLRHAMRYGAAAASLPGTQAPTPADLTDADIPVRRVAR